MLTAHQMRALAVQAEVDPRTVTRWLAGLPLTPWTQDRLDAGATTLGYAAALHKAKNARTPRPLAITSVKPPKA